MALVDYGTSDEDIGDDEDVKEAKSQFVEQHNLFAELPAPKSLDDLSDEPEMIVEPTEKELSLREKPPQQPAVPEPFQKKKKLIQLPALPLDDSDEEEEPKAFIPSSTKGSFDLFGNLPKPKYCSTKEVGRTLLPHILTKPKEPQKTLQQTVNAKVVQTPLASANIGAMENSKKTASHGVLSANYESDDEDDTDTSKVTNYFSFSAASADSRIVASANVAVRLAPVVDNHSKTEKPREGTASEEYSGTEKPREGTASEEYSGTEKPREGTASEEYSGTEKPREGTASEEYSGTEKPREETASEKYSETSLSPADAPLNFRQTQSTIMSQQFCPAASNSKPDVGMPVRSLSDVPGDYSGVSQDAAWQTYQTNEYESMQYPEYSSNQEAPSQFQSPFGRKRKRGQEEIQVIEVNLADHLTGASVEQTKSLTVEKDMKSHSKKRNKDMPTSQQKRKHQITFLAHQAKERELELKNQWAENKFSKKQTQSKYGF